MNDHRRSRQRRADRVVVGDDELDPELARRSASATAEIPQSTVTITDAWDSRQPRKAKGTQSVAFVHTMRNVVFDLGRAGQLQASPENARPADSVHVVIAVNDDLSALADRLDD